MGQEVPKTEALLKIRDLNKSFTGTKALNNVSLDFYPGEVHALLGENGAGKSTLIKILSGIYTYDSGEFYFKGKKVEDVKNLKLAVIHQDLGLDDSMSVEENIAVISGYKTNGITIDWKSLTMNARDLLSRMDSDIDPKLNVGDLSAAEKSIVAISRALAKEADILILDEPTATLSVADVEKLFEVIETLRSAGLSIIYVTHRMDEVFRISNRISVLRNGQLISTHLVSETNPDELVFDIVGRKPSELFVAAADTKTDQCILEVQNYTNTYIKPISFKLNKGEMLGLFGLTGAGHHDIGRMIFGDEPVDSGSIYIDGKPQKIRNTVDATKLGIGFLSSKRLEESLSASFTVRENIYLNPVADGTGLFQLMSMQEEKDKCQAVVNKFKVKPNDGERAIGTLSGGNQQKAVLARLFEARCDIMILEEPTIGVDVGSKSDIYEMMNEGLANGKAIILVSSDYEEVSKICKRVLIFCDGQVIAELKGNEISSDSLIQMAMNGLSSNVEGVV